MLRRLIAWLVVVAPLVPAVAAEAGILTLADGEVTIMRDTRRFAAAEGVRVLADDIVTTAATTRVARVEYADGSVLDLGPESAAWIAPAALSGGPRSTAAYLARGWAKWTSAGAQGGGIASPRLDLARLAGTAVIRVEAGADAVFVEGGRADVRDAHAAPQTLAEGDAWSSRDGRGQRLRRAPAEWATAMPRTLADSLPRRAARWQATAVPPGAMREARYDEAASWINAEPALRPMFLARFGPLARDKAFRAAAVAELKLHPEWKNLLFPPPPPPPKPKAPAVAAKPASIQPIHPIGQRAEQALQDHPTETAP